jgi:hypothetical protein
MSRQCFTRYWYCGHGCGVALHGATQELVERLNGECESSMERRTFNSLLASLPLAGRAGEATPDPQGTFATDVARSYEQQRVAFDMEDVAAIFDGIRDPSLAVAVASGADTHVAAARAAMRRLGGIRAHTLVIIATPPGEGRLLAFKQAMNTVRAHADPDGMVIYGACDDSTLAAGSVRVSILTG